MLAKLVTPEEGEKELSEIRASLSEHHSGKLFSFGVLVIFIGIMLSVFQQFVGINVVLYYATDIFKGMGLTTNASLLADHHRRRGQPHLHRRRHSSPSITSAASRCRSSARWSWR